MLDINAPHDKRTGVGRARAALDRLVRVTNSRTATRSHIDAAHVCAHRALGILERRTDWNELPG